MTPLTGTNDTLGLAIVGCGYWGANYIRLLNELPTVNLVAACDSRRDRLEPIEQRYPGTATTMDFDGLVGRPDVDAVVLCTQAASHRNLGLRCLAAGKHVLVEKPLTTRTADAVDLMRAAEAGGLTLMVGHTFIYNPAIQLVKQYLTQGEEGCEPVYYLYARRTNLGPIRTDVNAIWDLAPHDVSIFNYLLGREPEWVSATGARPLGTTREDVGFVTLGYGQDVLAHVHVSWADPNKTREVVVVCEGQRIVFNDLDPFERVRIFEKGVERRNPLDSQAELEPEFALREGRIVSPLVPSREPLRSQVEHFVECIRSGDTPLTDATAGLAVVRAMEAIDRSLDQSGVPVRVSVDADDPVGGEDFAGSIR
jgi:predicted dehydrogenase